METPINILTYISNLFAGKMIIDRIYNYVDDANRIVNIGGCKTYHIHISHIGNKYYTAQQLAKLDKFAFCNSLEKVFDLDISDISLDEYVIILLKGRKEFIKLYQAYYNATDKANYGGLYCLTFINPFSPYVELNKNKISLIGSEIISLNNSVMSFNSRLVIGYS